MQDGAPDRERGDAVNTGNGDRSGWTPRPATLALVDAARDVIDEAAGNAAAAGPKDGGMMAPGRPQAPQDGRERPRRPDIPAPARRRPPPAAGGCQSETGGGRADLARLAPGRVRAHRPALPRMERLWAGGDRTAAPVQHAADGAEGRYPVRVGARRVRGEAVRASLPVHGQADPEAEAAEVSPLRADPVTAWTWDAVRTAAARTDGWKRTRRGAWRGPCQCGGERDRAWVRRGRTAGAVAGCNAGCDGATVLRWLVGDSDRPGFRRMRTTWPPCVRIWMPRLRVAGWTGTTWCRRASCPRS